MPSRSTDFSGIVGREDKRKLALIVDTILDYVAENKDKAVYYDKMCGARK